VHFLQIWIHPAQTCLPPGYEQKHFDAAGKRGRLRLIAAPDGAQGAVRIHQDARVYAGLFDGSESAEIEVAAGRRAWLQVARGSLSLAGTQLRAGDAAFTQGPARLSLSAASGAEVLLFDLA
jgi:quercetin 2,3-dioxygenase